MTNEQVLQYCQQLQLAREPPVLFHRDPFLLIRSLITGTVQATRDGPSNDMASRLAQYLQWMEHQENRVLADELAYDQR